MKELSTFWNRVFRLNLCKILLMSFLYFFLMGPILFLGLIFLSLYYPYLDVIKKSY